MAMKWNLEMGREFFMEIWNWYERSRELEIENKKLKEKLEWYKNHYWDKPLTTIEEVKNHKWNTIWM